MIYEAPCNLRGCMIIVTGTKRSGTSMWMQLLRAAGFPPIGEAFPKNWEKTIREANQAGFWESKLRTGIYYKTNPDPETGAYLFPEDTRRHAVKVFIPGLIRTDRAYIGKVIATFRPWRQYVRSLSRLYAMERANKAGQNQGNAPDITFMSPVIEWWIENFSLLSDIVTRRYPFYMVSYEAALEQPDKTIRAVFDWLGDGDVEAAIQQVEPTLRTQDDDLPDAPPELESDLEPEVIEVFDALGRVIRAQEPLQQSFLDRLNETNEKLSDRIEAAVREAAKAQVERLRRIEAERKEREAEGSR